MTQNKKTAVVLMNLGGPDSREAIAPFLFNFFMDPNIIRAPLFIRWPLAKFIAWRRSQKEAGDSYAVLGNRSPLLENTTAQAKALDYFLNESDSGTFKTFITMRYWHPMADETAQAVKEYAPDHIVLLPLYPQFSTTTTRSSFAAWDKAAKETGLTIPTARLCCYPADSGFIEAAAEKIRAVYKEAQDKTGKTPRVLLSAHGLPEKIVKDGDPYQWQCGQTAEAIVKALRVPALDWQICYQSRVGPLKWIGPSTEEALQKAARDKVPVVIFPHAFTQEHVETLVEIEEEYREMAREMELHDFYRVETVGIHAAFIEGLADMVLGALHDTGTRSNENKPLCPQNFSQCCMRIRKDFDRRKSKTAA